MEINEPSKLSHPIAIDYRYFAEFLMNTKPDIQRAKSLNIVGNWIFEIENKVVFNINRH